MLVRYTLFSYQGRCKNAKHRQVGKTDKVREHVKTQGVIMKLQDLLKDTLKEGMTADEILKAIEDVELPESNSNEIAKLKEAVSKANSEAANYKKQLNAHLSEEEKKQAEKDEELSNLKNQLAALQKEKEVADNKAQFIAVGYDDKLAESSAKALLESDFKTVFANQKTFLEGYSKSIESNLLKDTPRPNGNNYDKTVSKEQFDKMSYSEKVKMYNEQPQLYAELTKK